jgi:hypothetical protein
MARCGLLRMLGGWGDLLWREWRRGGTYAADAEASLGSGALGKCARAKAVASHRTPYTLPLMATQGGSRDGTSFVACRHIFALISWEKVLGIWPIQNFRHVLGLQPKRAEPGLMQRKAINGVWRVRIWRLGGWGCRGRHFSRARGNPDRRRGLWECRPAAHRHVRGRDGRER